MQNRQAGMTLISILLIAAMVGALAYGAVRLTPVYLTQMKIRSILTGLKDEYAGQEATPAQLMNAIAKRLDIEMVDFPKRQDFRVTKTDSGHLVEVSYEDRVPYIANLYLVAVFDNSVEIRR